MLSVRPTVERDDAGLFGGRLSSRLTFMLVDVTDGTRPVTVYSGPVAGIGTLPLGTVEPGAEHVFVLVASLDRGGSADNAIQGATYSTGFQWTLSASSAESTPTPDPAATATPAPAVPTPVPSTPGTGGPAGPAGPGAIDPTGAILGEQLFPLPGSRRCVSRRRFTIHIRRPKGLRFRS